MSGSSKLLWVDRWSPRVAPPPYTVLPARQTTVVTDLQQDGQDRHHDQPWNASHSKIFTHCEGGEDEREWDDWTVKPRTQEKDEEAKKTTTVQKSSNRSKWTDSGRKCAKGEEPYIYSEGETLLVSLKNGVQNGGVMNELRCDVYEMIVVLGLSRVLIVKKGN